MSLVASVHGFANSAVLLLLIYIIFSLGGMQLFGKVAGSKYITANANFRSFKMAFITLFGVSTGDNWTQLAHSLATKSPGCVEDPQYNSNWCEVNGDMLGCVPLDGCGSFSSLPFFYLFTLVVSMILLNLFVGVLLDGMTSIQSRIQSQLLTEEAIHRYNMLWDELDPGIQHTLPAYEFPLLLRRLDRPLGLPGPERSNNELVLEFIKKLNVQVTMVKGQNMLTYLDITMSLFKEILKKVHNEAELDEFLSYKREPSTLQLFMRRSFRMSTKNIPKNIKYLLGSQED